MTGTPPLPPVAPAVTAALVGALSPRLRKRLDAAAAKLTARPLTRDGDTVRVQVDDETALALHAPTGSVLSADDIRCDCLLAPACVHRAAIATAAPVADDAPPQAPGESAAAQPATGPGTAEPPGGTVTPEQLAAAQALWSAAASALEAGIDGAGAVLQAELLGAAHTARLAALPRPATAAITVVGRLRAARAADPAHRLTDLTTALGELLHTTHGLARPEAPDAAALRGTARRTYNPGGSLRLYGLFTEPVRADSGHAGAVTWTADADGRLYNVPDVMPGGAERAATAVTRTIRLGDTALTHRELSRAGLSLSGATVTPDGRLGAGAAVRAVRATGAAWDEEPLAQLWSAPPAAQAARALDALALPEPQRPPGADLLFLDVTVVGALRETGREVLLADCGGLGVRLVAADDHPALAHRDNLRLLAMVPGLALRVVGRLVPAAHPRLRLLAVGRPPGHETVLRTPPGSGHTDLGHDRLQRGDLPPGRPVPAGTVVHEPAEAPLHLLRRRTDQAAAAGRRTLALPGRDGGDGRRLRTAGLRTGAALLDELHRAAADRGRDVFGRLLPADADRFARAWLAVALYTDSAARTLCAAAWHGPGGQEGAD
ncbi:hypothetical protein [Streptomyces avicenniae]|uniref:hypothetical protein n=1 Tax=Streptomyces avicenniae TaxID=500153 RepID=UPI000699F68A|nr:hypothetical protein [Streptomyces avicenniae]